MKSRIFYITRTLPDNQSGGALIRRGTIKYLKEKGYTVTIVAPSDKTFFSKDLILINGNPGKWGIKLDLVLYQLRLIDDYLERWSNHAYNLLKDIVRSNDIILATSGGELGTIMLAAKLKQHCNCKVIYNLHDPIDYTLLEHSFSFDSKLITRSRDDTEFQLFDSADKIITSSSSYCEILKVKYPIYRNKLACHHFGFIEKIQTPQLELLHNDRLNVVYGGNMGRLQGPEILIDVALHIPENNFTLVGNVNFDTSFLPSNITILPKMSYDKYIEYLISSADIGFFSLRGNVSKYCVPSKLYEYINVGIPIVAAIEGDGRDIINTNNIGLACDYSVESIVKAIKYMSNLDNIKDFKYRLLNVRENWYMGNTINELISAIRE